MNVKFRYALFLRPFMDAISRGARMTENHELSQDLLRGADEIALFIFGDRSKRRKIYHLNATSRLKTFRLGSMLCARRSVLLGWIADQESRLSANGKRTG